MIFSSFSAMIIKYRFQDLTDEKSKIIHDTLAQQIQLYFQHRTIRSEEGVSRLIEYIKKTHDLALKSVGME